MSNYANSNPETWDYTSGTSGRSYRQDTIAPTESAQEWAGTVAQAAGAKPCQLCGRLTFQHEHDAPMCSDCQDTQAHKWNGTYAQAWDEGYRAARRDIR